MSRFSFSMDEHSGCGVCGANTNQSALPELRYVIDNATGKGASVQCCSKCVREIDQAKKTEAAAAVTNEKLDHLKLLDQQIKEREAKLAALTIVPDPIPEEPEEIEEAAPPPKPKAAPAKKKKKRRYAKRYSNV